jgi:DNA-binding CsgD family transcriptional regulator
VNLSADENDLIGTIGQLYDCAGSPDAWPDALARVSRFVGGTSGHFLVFTPAQVPIISVVGGLDPASGAEYDAHYAQNDPRPARWFARLGQVSACHHVVDVEEFNRTAFVADFLNRWDARWCMAGTFALPGDVLGLWSAMRGEADGPFLDDECRRLEVLLPHISRAVELQIRLGTPATAEHSFAEVLDALGHAAFVLDGRCRILHANAAAETLVAEGSLLTGLRGYLSARSPEVAQGIAAAVARTENVASAGNAEQRVACVSLAAMAAGWRRIEFFRLSSAWTRAPSRPAAILAIVMRREIASRLSVEVMRRRFALTGGEATLAASLAAGNTLQEFAANKCVSIETVRTQLKSIFRKTGARRQADLVRLLID